MGLLGVSFGVLLFAAFAMGQFRIPMTQDGHHYGLYGSQVHVEMFYDLQCDDCQKAWPHIRSVFEYYPPGQIEFTLHHLPLPFHRNAFAASVALEVVAEIVPDRVWDFVDVLFKNQKAFSNGVTANMTDAQVRHVFGELGTSVGVDANTMEQALHPRSSASHRAKSSFKYVLQRGGVSSTPSYAVNGVMLTFQNIEKWTQPEWIAFFDKFFNNSNGENGETASKENVQEQASNSMLQIACAPGDPCEQQQQQQQQQQDQQALISATKPVLSSSNNNDEDSGCMEKEDSGAVSCPRSSASRAVAAAKPNALDVMNATLRV